MFPILGNYGIQIKSTLRFYLSPIRVAKINEQLRATSMKLWLKRNAQQLLVAITIITVTLKTTMKNPHISKKKSTIRPN